MQGKLPDFVPCCLAVASRVLSGMLQCKVSFLTLSLVACQLRADLLPNPGAVPSEDSAAQAKNTKREGGGVAGGEFTVTDS